MKKQTISSIFVVYIIFYGTISIGYAQSTDFSAPPRPEILEFIAKNQEWGTIVYEADKLREAGKFKDAMDVYQAAAKVRPEGSYHNVGILQCYLGLKENEKAFALFQKLYPLGSIQQEPMQMLYAVMLHQRGMKAEAANVFNKVIKVQDKYINVERGNPPIDIYLADEYYSKTIFESGVEMFYGIDSMYANNEKSIQHFRNAIKMRPRWAVAHFYLALMLKWDEKTYKDAIDEYLLALKYNLKQMKIPVLKSLPNTNGNLQKDLFPAVEAEIARLEGKPLVKKVEAEAKKGSR